MTEKPTLEEFPHWARTNLNFDPDDSTLKNWIDTNVGSIRTQLQQHEIVNRIQDLIEENQAAFPKREVNIIGAEFQIDSKSYSSILSKLYRANIVGNRNFPAAPRNGWVTPANMYGRVNDLVRSMVVCRHIDEPAKIAEKIVEICKAIGINAESTAQTKQDGYYAYHVYVRFQTTLVDRSWQQFSEDAIFEIQITTQMQHMLYALTHMFYDRDRNLLKADRDSWKWDYKSARFSASYLSHTLHLLEGLILRLYEDIDAEGLQKADSVSAGADQTEGASLQLAGTSQEGAYD